MPTKAYSLMHGVFNDKELFLMSKVFGIMHGNCTGVRNSSSELKKNILRTGSVYENYIYNTYAWNFKLNLNHVACHSYFILALFLEFSTNWTCSALSW